MDAPVIGIRTQVDAHFLHILDPVYIDNSLFPGICFQRFIPLAVPGGIQAGGFHKDQLYPLLPAKTDDPVQLPIAPGAEGIVLQRRRCRKPGIGHRIAAHKIAVVAEDRSFKKILPVLCSKSADAGMVPEQREGIGNRAFPFPQRSSHGFPFIERRAHIVQSHAVVAFTLRFSVAQGTDGKHHHPRRFIRKGLLQNIPALPHELLRRPPDKGCIAILCKQGGRRKAFIDLAVPDEQHLMPACLFIIIVDKAAFQNALRILGPGQPPQQKQTYPRRRQRQQRPKPETHLHPSTLHGKRRLRRGRVQALVKAPEVPAAL